MWESIEDLRTQCGVGSSLFQNAIYFIALWHSHIFFHLFLEITLGVVSLISLIWHTQPKHVKTCWFPLVFYFLFFFFVFWILSSVGRCCCCYCFRRCWAVVHSSFILPFLDSVSSLSRCNIMCCWVLQRLAGWSVGLLVVPNWVSLLYALA